MRKIEEPIVEIPAPGTLRQLSQAQRQEILEASIMAIVTQGGPSELTIREGLHPIPAYRGDSGRKCVIGHWILDEFYEEWFEGETLENWYIRNALEKSLGLSLGREDFDFFETLQHSHDAPILNASSVQRGDHFWSMWTEELIELCHDFKLRFPEELI